MHRRCDQQRWSRGVTQRLGDIFGEKRAAAVDRDRCEQRQQHRQLHAIHMLRRHGGDQWQRFAVRPQMTQRGEVLRGADAQAAPGLGIGFRIAGTAGGETDHRHRIGVDFGPGTAALGQAVGQAFGQGVQARRRRREHHIGDAIAVGGLPKHVLDRRRRARGRQQIDLPAQGDRAESDQEPVAVFAQIDRAGRFRQAGSDAAHFGEESTERDVPMTIEGEHAVESPFGKGDLPRGRIACVRTRIVDRRRHSLDAPACPATLCLPRA